MRILIANWKDSAHPAAGGAEVYTHEIARRWVRWGHQVTLFAAAVEGRPAREDVDGVMVVRQGSRTGVYGALRRRWPGWRDAFDVVVDEVNTRPFLTPRFVTVPVVALAHQVAREIWHYETPLPVALLGRHILEPRWLRVYRDIPTLTISRSSAESLRGYGLRDVHVVPVGVDAPPVHVLPPKERLPTVVVCGRVAGVKRPEQVLEAFARVRRRLPEARLWMVGDGPLRRRLQRRGDPGVTWWGRVDRDTKYALLARAHVQALASVREGWGLVVDEAASVGTPTVAYDRPGLRDAVPAARGVLVEARPAALAAELVRGLSGEWRVPRATGWSGGAQPWDRVAEEVLNHVNAAA